MINKISFGLFDEAGEFIEIEKQKSGLLISKLETAIAEIFSEICFKNNSILAEDIQIAEKFNFALSLKNYLKEMEQND